MTEQAALQPAQPATTTNAPPVPTIQARTFAGPSEASVVNGSTTEGESLPEVMAKSDCGTLDIGNINIFSEGTAPPPPPQTPQIQTSRIQTPRIQAPRIQAKLTIGEPNDKYEQEADNVAAQVVQRINSPLPNPPEKEDENIQRSVQQKPSLPTRPLIQQQSSVADFSPLQRKGTAPVGPASDSFESELNQARGGGTSLAPELKGKMESAMGADFSGVKVHTDTQASQLSQSIQAKAFTTGRDVFFKQGEYNPGSRSGQELIAHELTHVVQQSGNQLQRRIQRDDESEDGTVLPNPGRPRSNAIAEPTGRPRSNAIAEPTGRPRSNAIAEPTGRPRSNAIAEPTGRPRSNAIAEPTGRPRSNAIVGTAAQKDDPETTADKAADLTEDISDAIAAGSGITGDFGDVGLTVNTDNYSDNPNTDLSEQGAAKINNPLCDIGEGANIGLGLVNIRGAQQEWQTGSKGRAAAQGLDGVGHVAHGGTKLAKGIASVKDGAANADWTQVGDSGAAIGDGLGMISGLILSYKNVISTRKKSKEQGGLTTREKVDAAVSGVVNTADIAQSGLNTTKDIVKAVTEVGANSEATKQAISGMAQGAAGIGIVIGSIQTIHGAIKIGQGFYNKGQIQQVKQHIRKTVLKLLEQDIPDIQENFETQLNDISTPVDTFIKTLQELIKLENAFEKLKGFYEEYAPAMDAMSKVENRRMEQGAMKMAQGTVAVASSALLLSGVGAPIAIAIAAIGGILSLSNLALKWRRNKAASRLTQVAANLDSDGRPVDKPDDNPPAYQEMERRVYKCYYNNLSAVMTGQASIAGLTKGESTDVKNFSWEDKRKRIDGEDRHSVKNLGEVDKLHELTKREHWIQVKSPDTQKVTHKEKPKGSSYRNLKISASAHKSDAAMGANAETIAIALYTLGSGSYNTETQKFVDCPVQAAGDAGDAGNIDMTQIENQTSTKLLKVADINEKRWAAWLEKTNGNPDEMRALIKAQVLGKKSPKVKGRGGRGLRDYSSD